MHELPNPPTDPRVERVPPLPQAADWREYWRAHFFRTFQSQKFDHEALTGWLQKVLASSLPETEVHVEFESPSRYKFHVTTPERWYAVYRVPKPA